MNTRGPLYTAPPVSREGSPWAVLWPHGLPLPTQHHLGGGGGPHTHTHRLLKDWANFSSAPLADQNCLWRLRRLRSKFFFGASKNSAPLKGGGVFH